MTPPQIAHESSSARQRIEPAVGHRVYTLQRHLVFVVKRLGKFAPEPYEHAPNQYDNLRPLHLQ
jgi:hypothetical protein